jgi:pantoate--beta-alanine ligase
MHTVRDPGELQSIIAAWRQAGERIAFVPTMGNLHEGHRALLHTARRHADRVVVSIYVNPMQFGENEDFDAYPRTPEADARILEADGVDLLFMPDSHAIYPQGVDGTERLQVPGLEDILCGASRPGHFSGVATVVARLFELVQPEVAVFGKKDFQQLLLVRRMAADRALAIDIIGVDTVREDDGLALSSRNRYLTPDERRRAPVLYRALCAARDRILAGDAAFADIEQAGAAMLEAAGLRPDYFSVRRAADLGPPGAETDLVVLAAAWLGKARLIDNIDFSR